MPRDGMSNGLDNEWLAWWYTFGPPSEDQYPTEFADAMRDERGRRHERRARDASSAQSPAFAGVRAMLKGFATRLRGFRPEMAGATDGAREVSLAAKQS